MAFHWCDNIHTTVFTPRDYQVELLANAFERNTIICLGHKSSKEFIALKLLQELARQTRSLGQFSIFLTCATDNFSAIFTLVKHLTDLKIFKQNDTTLEALPAGYHVYIVNPSTCLAILRNGGIKLSQVNALVVEDCHQADVHREVMPIFKEFLQKTAPVGSPKVLGLAGPLHSAGCALKELGAMLNTLEESLQCKAETASDIVTVLRYCAKPMEFIVQCAAYEMDELTSVIEDMICTRRAFLNDHRYDPSEIYNTDEFLEELKDIPDPKKEPLELLDTMLSVLHEMGPWCADRVAMNMFQRIDKQKIKTPHERHFILLCLVSTTLVTIHTLCEQTFRNFANQKELIERYSSPKVLRLLEILRLFKPEEFSTENETMQRISQELDQMQFNKLTRSLEYSCQSVENISRQQLESRSIIDNLDPLVKPTEITATKQSNQSISVKHTRTENVTASNRFNRHNAGQGARPKRKPYIRRQMKDGDVDTLCAIIFCNTSYTARVLFDLMAVISRHDPNLKYLKCQFTVDRIADAITEPKEAELEHRRQEEVLKRFRMHDCNVLIGTSVLEEGIDVPKCNLVVRWDPPQTYRSYVQCKGRARAASAYHVILIAPKFEISTLSERTSETLTAKSHIFLCNNVEAEDEFSDTESSEDSDEDNISNQFTIGSSKGIVKILNPEVITSKPPTINELTLQEIRDEALAIEAISEEVDDYAKQKSDELNLSISTETAMLNSSSDIFDENNCYTVLDLSDTISDVNSQLTDSLYPPNKKKEKKKKQRFSCCLQTAENEAHNNISIVDLDRAKIAQLEHTSSGIVEQLAQYREMEKMLLQKCANTEPLEEEHHSAEKYTNCLLAYKPLPHLLTGATVDLSNAIAMVNKYCSKLPSDTFTKLTALWRCATAVRCGVKIYQYTLRLPINSPLKYDIVGLPMSTQVLARRMAALQTCIELHKNGELDDNLQPIGKEGFRALESDWESFELEEEDEKIVQKNAEPRPGTTKRRQYYYKRIASEFCDCRPTASTPCYLYLLDLTLQCPIPEEQNTRGRKIYPPEEALQGFGILTMKKIPKVSSFPIFTRSGEVKVAIELAKEQIELTTQQIICINTFLNYTFTNVLRLQKFLMRFDPDSTENCVFIVPTIKSATGRVIDWDFLKLIEKNSSLMPIPISECEREQKQFEANKFKDAVVMPWYRNIDQPQYFYVAEICPQLSPLSCFPGGNYRSFKHYYLHKYGLAIQNTGQPLLDVDHTSARLNFLTPRYVNRKGVALPTSSEETKRAKRENLEQKQILVPELCTVHPFPASLWRTAVCLPCILYRINGLLLADDIRKKVAADIGLGQQKISDNFEWPMLDFGWSLSEVLKKSKENKNDGSANETTAKIKQNGCVSKSSDSLDMDKSSEMNCVEKSANEIVMEGEQKLQNNSLIEIGTWTNDMATLTTFAVDDDDDEDIEKDKFFIPPDVSFCDRDMRIGSPTFWRNKEEIVSTYYVSDESFASSYDGNDENFSSDEEVDEVGPLRIAFTSKNEAETIETEQEIEKHNKQLSIIQATTYNERYYQETKNLQVGYNFTDLRQDIADQIESSVAQFVASTKKIRAGIKNSGMLVTHDSPLRLPKKNSYRCEKLLASVESLLQMLPYAEPSDLRDMLEKNGNSGLTVEDVANINAKFVKSNCSTERFNVEGCGDIFDNFNDKANLEVNHQWRRGSNNKLIRLNFEQQHWHKRKTQHKTDTDAAVKLVQSPNKDKAVAFSFDYQPDLSGHPGPSPSIILQALTMSNANDGINLERLETIGDSFLKYAITTYLYITYEMVHEGKLSHLRSRQVANLNLYRLGRRKMLGEFMIATKFEPHDNWLPPCYYVPKELERALIEAKIPPHCWRHLDLTNIKKLSSAEICTLMREQAEKMGHLVQQMETNGVASENEALENDDFTCFIPYNLVTQHSIPDKSVADCVEALIGAYLIECGSRGALLFMAWLGIRVLPVTRQPYEATKPRTPGSTTADKHNFINVFGEWTPPKSPLLHYSPNAAQELDDLLEGFDEFENTLGYKFRDRSYLLQAMTHASYSPNRLTDCYQRLEFLGDAVLDYLITRHLYEDPRQHSPGALTDLRSALVNNTIFASLAVRHGFHKYFRHFSPGLNEVIDRFVRIQNENGHSISEEYYLLSEEECDDAEDVEVPKALGDVFESIAGAIFLDSNMSLDIVWQVYSNMMRPEIEEFSNSVPKSPIRELLELEPETAKFGKPEKLADGRRVRVTVDVFCKGTFRGIGRNYRIAKCTAAKCALRQLKKQGFISKKE